MSIEKDPWLQQALRHAPDHDVAVPAAVRDTILQAARAAVRQPQPAPPRRWWQRLLAPLARPARLGYSGAFMALLVVGLWGLDRLDQPAVAPEQAPVLSAPATAPAAATPASPAPANATSASPATPTPPAEPAQATAVADKAAPKEAAESRQMAVAAKAKVGAQAERQRREEAPPASAAPTQAAAPVLAPPEPAADMVAAAKPVAAATPAGPASPRLEATLAAAIPRKAAVPSPARNRAAANATEPASPLAAMLDALRTADGSRWQTAQAQGLHGFLQNQWLGRLLQLTPAGPWQPVVVVPESPPTVQWLGRDGGQLWLQADGQCWLAWRGQAQGARLPPAEAMALLAQLAEWH